MTDIVIFAGPTISSAEARLHLDAVYLPPVSQGDLYRTALARSRAIGVIDGYFERVPAVWHKEILWAMEQGIHVYGSSSLGALRAAELHTFGMVGVGRIFEAFRDGLLEDDDEVALVHGPAECGFRAISEPMVNIRATLGLARAEGILGDDMMSALIAIAKSLFYKERSYSVLLRCGLEAGLSAGKIEELRAWLPTNRVDQKKQDAVEMLHRMAADIDAATPSKTVQYRTEQTEWWQAAKDHFAAFPMTTHRDASALELFLDEVRLDLPAFPALRRNAMVRHLAWIPTLPFRPNKYTLYNYI